ncbi:MAG: hypothetical protein ABIH46_06430, partial [Chloroflexota bacterium]
APSFLLPRATPSGPSRILCGNTRQFLLVSFLTARAQEAVLGKRGTLLALFAALMISSWLWRERRNVLPTQ